MGDIVIDLYTSQCPCATRNFLKLCKIKYYNNVLFHNVTKDFVAQTGDPTGTGKGGDSIYRVLYGYQARFFDDEIRSSLKHERKGTVSMASAGQNRNASQFLITLRDNCDALDGQRTVFGTVSEGFDVLEAINNAYCDDKGRPYQNIRIRHTIVLDDPFDDPPGFEAFKLEASPLLPKDPDEVHLEDVPPLTGVTGTSQEHVETNAGEKETHSRAVLLEMIGDLPDVEAKPPEECLFICRLNPVTTDEDLEIIFSRFGKVQTCDIIRDHKTGDSLNFAFISFATKEEAETAYFKMDNVLIDDRRVRVDFSQSMHSLWKNYRRFGRRGGTREDGDRAYSYGNVQNEKKHTKKGCEVE